MSHHQLDSTYRLVQNIQEVAAPVRLPRNVAEALAQTWLTVMRSYQDEMQNLAREEANPPQQVEWVLLEDMPAGMRNLVANAIEMLQKLASAKEEVEARGFLFPLSVYTDVVRDGKIARPRPKEALEEFRARQRTKRVEAESRYEDAKVKFSQLIHDTAATQVKQTKLRLPADIVARIDNFGRPELPAAQEVIDHEPNQRS